ncbi:RNA-binding protein 45-like [Manduca sexta]|uniref:RRM domain-containing protein n=1 Tax=Manduca sexta TaxID=7130 RepID=A0A921ZIQ6_MANSE|nr:RNA-binding protein 45-like [Manduca sexta]KAG6457779.1 hypothetical protein O3G_MSEX010472 [Manduca sexta]
MNNWNQSTRNDDRNDDKPPYSRVFVVCSKQMREDDLRPVFEKYGNIDDVHMPRDRTTGESRGIAYIKYAKTSSAAAAIQDLHLTTLPNNSHKPIKVMVATNKNDSQNNNPDKYRRLFIKVPKECSESEIRSHFSTFGRVESVRLQRDKVTDECKGFAYVHYTTFLDAAKALEECDRKYKPIFATPKDELKRGRNSLESFESYSSNFSLHKDSYHDYHHPRDDKRDNVMSLIKSKPQEYDTVAVTCSPPVLQKYLERLFNVIPGMMQCKYSLDQYNGCCKAFVTYDSEKSASYAVEKLNNFEYPSGEIISVKPDENPLSKAANNLTSIVNNIKNAVEGNPDLLQLADAIAEASTLIKAASSGREIKSEAQDNYCSVNLPPVQPMSSNNKVAQRCFLVFKPHPPPVSVLRDTFCRFGDLIDVATFPNKTFGFAKYASVKSAQDAMKTLHEATLCGIKLKVLEADEKVSNDNKMNVDNEPTEHDTERKRMKLDRDN